MEVVSLHRDSDVVQFQDALQAKYGEPNYLKDIPSDGLLVLKNTTAFDKGMENPLDPTESLGSLGSKEDMFVVVVFHD